MTELWLFKKIWRKKTLFVTPLVHRSRERCATMPNRFLLKKPLIWYIKHPYSLQNSLSCFLQFSPQRSDVGEIPNPIGATRLREADKIGCNFWMVSPIETRFEAVERWCKGLSWPRKSILDLFIWYWKFWKISRKKHILLRHWYTVRGSDARPCPIDSSWKNL